MKNIDLSGNWDFTADVGDTPNFTYEELSGSETEKFWKDSIYLPGTVSAQKKVPANGQKNTGFLTDPYGCTGFMWFRKTVQIQDYSDELKYSLLLERTRVSHLWINGEKIGENNSLCAKHIYDITPAVKNAVEHKITIVLMIDNVSYPTRGGHMTSPDTQTNWVGITGQIQLVAENKICLKNLRIKSSSKPELSVSAQLDSPDGKEEAAEISLYDFDSKKYMDFLLNGKSVFDAQNQSADKQPFFIGKVLFKTGKNQFTFTLPENTKLWSAENPEIYLLEIKSYHFNYSSFCGIKSFTVKGTHFEINGRREFLRGKHDGMIFPETGCAPCDEAAWLKVMGMSKSYGINHYRYHTSCPPEAAFTAADLLGIYMEPELPFWGTIQNVGEEGFNQAEQDYLISEGFKILDTFGNHTSFMAMSLGNELWGSVDRLNFILKNYRDHDDRFLYISGSNTFQFYPQNFKNEDFFVGCRFDQKSLIRGSFAMCDAPQGFVQTDEPGSDHDYNLCFSVPVSPVSEEDVSGDKEIEIQYGTGVKKVKASAVSTSAHFLPGKPVISHEVGQYCMYPDYKEIERYTGVLKPYNYEAFRDRLEKNGMINQAEDFFRDSSRLAVQCYKQEIEALIRSSEISGFQLLDLQDFTGQGTAVVGVLNAFMESKGIVSGSQWKSFCDETVLLAAASRFVWTEGETFKADIYIANYSDKLYRNSSVKVLILDCDTDEILAEDDFDNTGCEAGVYQLGTFTCDITDLDRYRKCSLVLMMDKNPQGQKEDLILNAYTLHFYPKPDSAVTDALKVLKEKGESFYKNVLLTTDSAAAKKAAGEGKKVLLIPQTISSEIPGALPGTKEVQTVPGTYCTDFWCYPMFRSISESMKKPVPVGTLGLTIKNDSKIFKDFVTDTYSTPKWYNLVSSSVSVNLTGTDIQPLVQTIDNVERNWKLGVVWQADGVMVCTSRLYELTEKSEAMMFAKSLLENI